MNVYRHPNQQKLYHLDAYRLANASEAEDLDINGLQESGPLVIEWADRIQPVLPDERLWINLEWVNTDQRDLLITARGDRYQILLHDLRKQVYGIT